MRLITNKRMSVIETTISQLEKTNNELRQYFENLDGIYNKFNMMGTDQDPESYYNYTRTCDIDLSICEGMYKDSGVFARIIDLLVDDSYREWFNIVGDHDGRIDSAWDKNNFRTHLNVAKKLSRLYGGAAILLGINDGNSDMSSMVNIPRIKSIDYMKIIDKRHIKANYNNLETDARSSNFGNPKTYIINHPYFTPLQNIEAHIDRLLIFKSKQLPDSETKIYDGFSFPLLQNLFKPIARLEKAYVDTSMLISRLYQDVLKIKGLPAKLAINGNKAMSDIETRLKVLNMTRSKDNMIFIDADGESVERLSFSIAGIADVLYKAEEFLSAHSGGYPVFKIFGSQPKGFNATDAGGTDSYYDVVRQTQLDDEPNILKIARYYAFALKINNPDELTISWNSPYQLNELEKSKIRLNDATSIEKYVNSQVITQDEGRKFLRTYDFYKDTHFVSGDDAPDLLPETQGNGPTESIETKDE